jgi:hypothetical protein
MRLATPLAIAAVLIAALLAGCGGSSSGGESQGEPGAPPRSSAPQAPAGAAARSCVTHAPGAGTLRATGISCDQARQVLDGWQRDNRCSAPAGASRTSCITRSYRCLGARTDRGIAVSCSRAGQSIAFLIRGG